jgi:hypothetical protein
MRSFADPVITFCRPDQALVTVTTTPGGVAWLLYPTIRDPRNPQPFISHVAIIEAFPAEFDPDSPDYRTLTVIQCRGPNGQKPAIIRSDGSFWWNHDQLWPKPQHRSVMVLPNAPEASS